MAWRRSLIPFAVFATAGVGALVWYRSRARRVAPPDAAAMHALLTRAAPLLRLPTSPDSVPDVLADGTGLRCRRTGQTFHVRDGILDLISAEPSLTDTQQFLNTQFSAWAYDRTRSAVMRLAGAPTFAQEVTLMNATLALQPGDTVLDLACGHGNFTVAWTRLVGSSGLVIGLDLSPAMLRRAAHRVQRAGLANVLLVRGDAQALPFADAVFAKINCSGGFHQLPDLPRALRELARVRRADSVLTASTFAEGTEDRQQQLKRWLRRRFDLHFVPLDWLNAQLTAVGYTEFRATLRGGWFAYTAARSVAPPRAS